MSRQKLIYTDIILVAMCLFAYATGGFQKNMLLMPTIIILVFVGCLKRHVNYYKLNKKIY
jgi:hypothetical protein